MKKAIILLLILPFFFACTDGSSDSSKPEEKKTTQQTKPEAPENPVVAECTSGSKKAAEDGTFFYVCDSSGKWVVDQICGDGEFADAEIGRCVSLSTTCNVDTYAEHDGCSCVNGYVVCE